MARPSVAAASLYRGSEPEPEPQYTQRRFIFFVFMGRLHIQIELGQELRRICLACRGMNEDLANSGNPLIWNACISIAKRVRQEPSLTSTNKEAIFAPPRRF